MKAFSYVFVFLNFVIGPAMAFDNAQTATSEVHNGEFRNVFSPTPGTQIVETLTNSDNNTQLSQILTNSDGTERHLDITLPRPGGIPDLVRLSPYYASADGFDRFFKNNELARREYDRSTFGVVRVFKDTLTEESYELVKENGKISLRSTKAELASKQSGLTRLYPKDSGRELTVEQIRPNSRIVSYHDIELPASIKGKIDSFRVEPTTGHIFVRTNQGWEYEYSLAQTDSSMIKENLIGAKFIGENKISLKEISGKKNFDQRLERFEERTRGRGATVDAEEVRRAAGRP